MKVRHKLLSIATTEFSNYLSKVVDLFIILFDTVRSQPDKVGHSKEGYYFAENFHCPTLELTETISNTLADLAVGSQREPDALPEEELISLIGVRVIPPVTSCYSVFIGPTRLVLIK